MFGMEDQNKQSASSLFSQPTPSLADTNGSNVPQAAADNGATTPTPASSPFSPAYPPEVSAMPIASPPTAAPASQPPTPLTTTPNILESPDPLTNPLISSHHQEPTTDSAASSSSTPSGAPEVDDALLDIKQKALEELSPLVEHLDQSPEEKFKTTMMMLQATDNQALVQQAYNAANAIEDKKIRAQALLDVVNEINYFTHQHQQDNPAEEQAA